MSEADAPYCACPLCSVFAALRETSPEAMAHLVNALAEWAAAARALLEAVEAVAPRPAPAPSAVQRITVT